MLYRDISLVSISGLRGSLHVHRARDAQGRLFRGIIRYVKFMFDGGVLT